MVFITEFVVKRRKIGKKCRTCAILKYKIVLNKIYINFNIIHN